MKVNWNDILLFFLSVCLILGILGFVFLLIINDHPFWAAAFFLVIFAVRVKVST